MTTIRTTAIALILTAGLTGCASDGNLFSGLSTGSVTTPTPVAAAPAEAKFSPACVSLAGQIDNLRKEGTVERLEKASAGKGDNVQVKRTALSKQTDLNKANADFQTRCGPALPKTAMVAPATPPPPPSATVAKKVASATAAAVTAKPATPPQAKDAAEAVTQAVPKAQ